MMEAGKTIDESRDLERASRASIAKEKRQKEELAARRQSQKAKGTVQENQTVTQSSGTGSASSGPAVPPPDPFAAYNAAMEQLKGRQGMLTDMMAASQNRAAPQIGPITPITTTDAMRISAPTTVGTMPTVSDTAIDPRAVQMSYEAAQGLAPSAAQNLLAQGVTQAGQLGMAMAGARGGYSPTAVRGAQRQASQAVQESAAQAAALRAQEMATARQEFSAIQTNQAQLTQQAKMFNATQEGQAILADAENQMRASLANQNMDLDVLKTNAARGDAIALANLQATMDTMRLNDAQQMAYLASILGIDESLISAEMAKLEYAQRPELARMGYQAAKDLALGQKQTSILGGVLSGAGAVIGGIYGGPVGSAVGSGIGSAGAGIIEGQSGGYR